MQSGRAGGRVYGGKGGIKYEIIYERHNYVLKSLTASINNLSELMGVFKWLIYLVTLQ